METNQRGRQKPGVVVWLAALCAVAVLGAGIAGEVWLRPAEGGNWQALLPAALLALAAVLGIVWLARARAARRWNAAVDAYAEREIARSRRKHAAKGGRSVTTPRGILQRLRASHGHRPQLVDQQTES
jgi:lysophospholipase L1-like esterase